MKISRCIANCNCSSGRRDFIKKSAIITAGALFVNNFGIYARGRNEMLPAIHGFGPASGYMPTIKAAFVRRKEEYGMLWPGAIYDGEAARNKYTNELIEAAKVIGVSLDLRETPFFNPEEADVWLKDAKEMRKSSRQDVINGIKSYLVAGKFLENEKADAISMDCLGALGNIDVSLPCISWSRMNDDDIPAACEADTGAIAAHILVQYLFDRPGFQQDPVADTSDDTLIGAHCSCPTRLNGFNNPPEPFELVHHHGDRDAVPRTIWKTGQRVTLLDFLPANEIKEERSQLMISTGKVVENLNAPPSGGCVVSVKYKMDSQQEVLSYPGFHQLFFYGDYKSELKEFAQLCNFDAKLV